MAKQKQKTARQSQSIARRLNLALVRRGFLRMLLVDLVFFIVLVVMWCGITESFYGGGAGLFSDRRFTGVGSSVADNVAALAVGNFEVTVSETSRPLGYVGENDTAYGELHGESVTYRDEKRLPFSGVYYVFDVGISNGDERLVTVTYGSRSFSYVSPGTVAVDASRILTFTVLGFLLVVLIEGIYCILAQFTGRRLIKKHLRPLDDMAFAAERLEATLHSASETETSRSAYTGIRLDDIESEEIAQAIDAIDAIDEANSRIDIPETELGGLEDAINNMLRRLDETQRHQIRFVDDASHELRTPIAVIQGYVNMLDRWGKNDEQVMDEAIVAIKSEAEHMKTLIDQLLFLARGEMERHVLKMEKLDVSEIISEIYDESVMLDGGHGYDKKVSERTPSEDGAEVSGSTSLILADAAMIKQAVRILRDNAVKYTPHGGSITFTVYERASVTTAGGGTSRAICIEVADTGMGIHADELSRIFDRFYRGSNVRSASASGSGLGLSIAKWIVDVHGGRIEAVSTPGCGTRMTVVLPAAQSE